MAQIDNYTTIRSNWLWTGVKNLNQMWSYFYVREPIMVDSIDIYWGGYDGKTKGRHFIARWTSGDGAKLNGLVALSDVINVPQGRGWRRASVKPVMLSPGGYAVGILGDFYTRRTTGLYTGDGGGAVYMSTNQHMNPTVRGTKWSPPNKGTGLIIPARLNGEYAGRVAVRANGSWRKGQAFVRVSGSWRRAKSVWVKQNGTWRRSN